MQIMNEVTEWVAINFTHTLVSPYFRSDWYAKKKTHVLRNFIICVDKWYEIFRCMKDCHFWFTPLEAIKYTPNWYQRFDLLRRIRPIHMVLRYFCSPIYKEMVELLIEEENSCAPMAGGQEGGADKIDKFKFLVKFPIGLLVKIISPEHLLELNLELLLK